MESPIHTLYQYSDQNGRHLALIDPYLSFWRSSARGNWASCWDLWGRNFFYHPVMYDRKTNPEKCPTDYKWLSEKLMCLFMAQDIEVQFTFKVLQWILSRIFTYAWILSFLAVLQNKPDLKYFWVDTLYPKIRYCCHFLLNLVN